MGDARAAWRAARALVEPPVAAMTDRAHRLCLFAGLLVLTALVLMASLRARDAGVPPMAPSMFHGGGRPCRSCH
jgi:hypothetical protein